MQLTICQRGTVGFEPTNQTVWAHHCLPYVSASSRSQVLPLCFTSDGKALVSFTYLSLSRTRTASSYQTSTTEQNRTAFRARVRIYTLHDCSIMNLVNTSIYSLAQLCNQPHFTLCVYLFRHLTEQGR